MLDIILIVVLVHLAHSALMMHDISKAVSGLQADKIAELKSKIDKLEKDGKDLTAGLKAAQQRKEGLN